MLKRLLLREFRHTKRGTELVFTEQFNVLLGRNGAGKTTLLDLISMVLRSDFSALREEVFDVEYEVTHERGFAIVRFENELARTASRGKPRNVARLGIKLRLERIEEAPEYEVEVVDARMRWRMAGATWEGGVVVDVFRSRLLEGLSQSIATADAHAFDISTTLEAMTLLSELNQQGVWAYRFDESLGVFEQITAGRRDIAPSFGQVPAPFTVQQTFDPMTKGVQVTQFFPDDYEIDPPSAGQASTNVTLPPLCSLAKFPLLAGMKGMSMSLAVEQISQQDDGVLCELGVAAFVLSGAGKIEFRHSALSYGQKRLLAFLYYLDVNRRFVVADELVNGMHHDWIRACLDEIRLGPSPRQAFLTSQNPILLDYVPLESVEQVKRSFIQCRAEIVDDDTRIVWSNLSAEDAADLFADYQVGIQPVGEILRARGLW